MVFAEGYALLVSVALVFFLPLFIPKQNKVRADRVGGDPGLFGFKTLPAKFKFLLNGHAYVNTRYNESKHKNYHLQSTNVDRLVLAPRYFPELCTLNTKTLSHAVASSQATIGQYSGVAIIEKDRHSVDVCKGGLTKSLPTLVPQLARLIKNWLDEELKDCNENTFTPRTALKFVFSLNSTATSLIFAGPSLTENKEWMQAFLDIQPRIAAVIIWMTPMPRILRNLIGSFLPPVKALKAHQEKIRRFLFPVNGHSPNPEFPTILDHYVATSKVVDEEDIAAKFLVLSTSAIHTVTNAVTQAIFDLCLHPQFIGDIREELEEALRLTNGVWTLDTVKRLKKLDSFLKESQRYNPHSYLSFNRVVLSEVKLSDGLLLPKNQFISFPAGPMAMDPEYHDNPEEFDAYRFLKHVTETTKGTSEYEHAGFEHGNLHWGGGMSTCPGRWYASAVMKIMVGLIVLEHDIKFPDGQTSRLPNAYLDTMIQPNDKQEVLFRKRV